LHPMEGSDIWVQPPPTVRKDGSWRVNVYIGMPGDADVGKHFEIMAIADPARPLKEGEVINSWPDAGGRSEVVEVTRK
jgi:hypothetical protein